jgi:hypothetical protein
MNISVLITPFLSLCNENSTTSEHPIHVFFFFSLESSKMASSIGSVNNDNQARPSVAGLKFGPDWMRHPNPPQQQEPIPQRQFALARNRYGREEMLQVAANH